MIGIEEKIRLEVKDRKLFSDIVVTEKGTSGDLKEKDYSEPEWRYILAVNIFREKLGLLTQEELKSLAVFINQKCVVIFLATPSFDDAFRLFTIVNDRGKQLRRIDILKALNIAPDIITSPPVRSQIAQQWETIEKDLGSDVFENVFYLLRLILLRDKPKGDLLKEFEQRIFAEPKLLQKGAPFFDTVFEYSKLYEAIFIDRDFVQDTLPEYSRFRSLIHIMDSNFEASEWRACLLAYAEHFGSTEFYRFCLQIEKVYLSQWVNAVRKDERFSDYAAILTSIANAKKKRIKKPDVVFTVIEGMYDLDEIKSAVMRSNFYTAGFSKYILLRFELVTSEHDAVHEFSAKSVEHVLPQKPDPKSDWAKEHKLEEISSYVDSIGNLVLLSKSKNSGAKNFDFKKKKEKYLQTRVSDYPRSVQVLGYNDWTKQIIETRTKEAGDLVLQDP